MKRRDKTNYYLDIAETTAERSTCLRRQYGAVIVKNDEVKEDIDKDIFNIQENNQINKKSTFKLISQLNNDIIQNVNNNSNR